jgi:hypothetical protein
MWCEHLFGERSAKPSLEICRCQGQNSIDRGREQMAFPFPHSAVQLPRNIGRCAGPFGSADEAKNRHFGGQHLNAGGEQQTFRDRQQCNRRNCAARFPRSLGIAERTATSIQSRHPAQFGLGEAGPSQHQRGGTPGANSCHASHSEKRMAGSMAAACNYLHGSYDPFGRRHR